MSAFGIIARLTFTLVMVWLTWRLLHKGVTGPRYTLASAGLFLTVVVWLADIERSSRIVIGAIEIDRRLELAQDAVARLERLEGEANDVSGALASLTTEAKHLSVELKEMQEREALRRWAMVTPLGMRAASESGGFGETGGPLTELSKKAFREEPEPGGAGVVRYVWDCDADAMKNLSALVSEYPLLPYARCALGICLKKGGDPQWRSEVEAANALVEKLIAIRPHVEHLEVFRDTCSEALVQP